MQPHPSSDSPSTQPLPAYLQAATSPDALEQLRRRGQRQIVFGVLWLVAGVALTLWSLNFGASFWVLYYGPVLYGIISVVLGARKIAKSRQG